MGCTLHDLRRTIATGLERFGVRLEVTEAVLNHTGAARTVASVYQLHNYKDEKRAALAAWRTTFASAGHRPAVPTSPRFALDGNCLCRCHCVLRPAAPRRPGPSRNPTSWIGDSSSSVSPIGRRSPNVYFDGEMGRRSAAHLLTLDEARRIVANINPSRRSCRRVLNPPPSGCFAVLLQRARERQRGVNVEAELAPL